MAPMLPGIHHVTAIASDPQRNVDFYVGTLGLRLIKRTVNFDDPGTYHLYYGDAIGTPGTIMTFFPWPGAPRGRIGTGQVAATAFSIARDAVPYWQDRLARHAVHAAPVTRFGEQLIAFEDPDGLPLELTVSEADPREGWREGPVPSGEAIRGFHSVTLLERLDACEPTASVLATLGFEHLARDGNRLRFAASGAHARAMPGSLVDILCEPGAPPGKTAAGTVHHVAWRTPDDAQQADWRQRIAGSGINVTPVRDRQYFRSIYFHEPGGVLFEIATDVPGFIGDESPERLGTALQLPPWLEIRRTDLERVLPPLRLPVPAA